MWEWRVRGGRDSGELSGGLQELSRDGVASCLLRRPEQRSALLPAGLLQPLLHLPERATVRPDVPARQLAVLRGRPDQRERQALRERLLPVLRPRLVRRWRVCCVRELQQLPRRLWLLQSHSKADGEANDEAQSVHVREGRPWNGVLSARLLRVLPAVRVWQHIAAVPCPEWSGVLQRESGGRVRQPMQGRFVLHSILVLWRWQVLGW